MSVGCFPLTTELPIPIFSLWILPKICTDMAWSTNKCFLWQPSYMLKKNDSHSPTFCMLKSWQTQNLQCRFLLLIEVKCQENGHISNLHEAAVFIFVAWSRSQSSWQIKLQWQFSMEFKSEWAYNTDWLPITVLYNPQKNPKTSSLIQSITNE